MAPIRPLPGDVPGPRTVGEGLDRVLRGLGAPERGGVALVFDRWAEVVGDAMAARTRPLRIEAGRLVLAVDEPAVATHLRFLEAAAPRPPGRADRPERITAIDLRVGKKR